MVKRVEYTAATMVRIQKERGAYLDLVKKDLLVSLVLVQIMAFSD